ncbi:MAG: sugar ABC transporter permease [Bowdeniella nasicola]|nr:sugar ABC transporter permease [Bowdeniella nasicola]
MDPPRNHRIRERHEARTGWAFMAPFSIAFLFVFIIPIVISIYKSFFRKVAGGGGLYGGGELVDTFVGFANYADVVTSSRFWLGMARVVGYTFIQVPIMILLALALALVLDSYLTRHVTIYRLGYFLPYAIPGVVAAMIWLYLYSPNISPLVQTLQSWGINIDFLGRNIVLASMANMTTWTYTGYNMLIFLAALQAIPHDLEEAARIDGATNWQITTKIKIPLVRGAALLAVLLSIVGTIQLFNEPTVLSSTATWMGGDFTPMMMAYNTMMGKYSPGGDGPASAISIVMALIAGILAIGYALVDRRISK